MDERSKAVPVRILHVTFGMDRGGMESRLMDLFRQTDQGRVVFDFLEHTVSAGAFDEEIKELGGRIYYSGYSRKHVIQAMRYTKRFLSSHEEYKIIHIHESYLPSINLAIMDHAKKYGKKVILHSRNAHGTHPFLHRLLKSRHSKMADYHFACSEPAAEWMFDKKTLQRGKYRIIKNAICVQRFLYHEAIRKTVRKQLGFVDEDIILGHIGRFYAQKNHGFLVDIMNELKELDSRFHLVMIGDGPLKRQIRELVKEKGLSAKVTFIGNQKDIERFYQAFDIFLLPSLYEGLPGVGVEAQACGLPCLFSDRITEEVEIIPELSERLSISKGVDIWRDRILAIAESRPKRRDMCEQMRKAGFDAAAVAEELTSFYERICRYDEAIGKRDHSRL